MLNMLKEFPSHNPSEFNIYSFINGCSGYIKGHSNFAK